MPMPATDLPAIVRESRDPSSMVVLRSANGKRCAKHFVRENGQIGVVPYDRESQWFVDVLPCVDMGTFVQGLEILTSCRDRIVVRGALRDDASAQPVMRRVVGAGAAFQAQARSWVALDVDGLVLPESYAAEPAYVRVAAVVERLPVRFRTAACFYQFTSSYAITAPLNVMRLRVWFRLNHPMTDAAWKRELRGEAPLISLDLSLFNPVQPHYVAAPTFQGMEDPLAGGRAGVHDPMGATPLVDVSDIQDRDAIDYGTAIVSAITRTGVEAHPDQINTILNRFATRARSASRHSTAVALIGELYGHGMNGEEATRIAGRWMTEQGRPPERGELQRALGFVQRRAQAGELRTNDTPISLMFDSEADPVPTPEEEQANRETAEAVTAEWPTQPNAMARRAYADLFRSEGYVRWGETDYEWTGTYWRPFADDEELGARVQRASQATPTAVDRAVKALRNEQHKGHLRPPCTLVDGRPIAPRIPCANGWLSVAEVRGGTALTLRPYNSEVFDTLPPMPVDYDPAATCPVFTAFLDQCFEGDSESREALIKLMGYLLFKGNEYQRAFICSGLPASGKSTWTRVMRALLGPLRATVGDLRAFSTDFGLAACYEAQALFLPEASHGEDGARLTGEAVDQIKRITGGDAVVVRRKYKDDVVAEVMPTPVIICNIPPVIRDEAFVRRLVTVHFPHSFVGREDPTLSDRLRAELPGILNLALEGLRRIGAQREPFPPPRAAVGDEEVSEARAVYEEIRTDASPLAEFMRRCLTRAAGTPFLTIEAIFGAYRRWCAANHHRALDERRFATRLRMGTPGARWTRRRGDDGARHRGLEGLMWTPEGERVQSDSGF